MNTIVAAKSHLSSGSILYTHSDKGLVVFSDAILPKHVDEIADVIHQQSLLAFSIILVNSVAMLERYVPNFPEVAADLIELSEDVLLVEFEQTHMIAHSSCGTLKPNVFVLVPEGFLAQLVQTFRRPILATFLAVNEIQVSSSNSNASIPEKWIACDCAIPYHLNTQSKRICFCADGTFILK